MSGNILQDIDRQKGAIPPNVPCLVVASSVAAYGVVVQSSIVEDLINEVNIRFIFE